MAIERAKRLVEHNRDVVILLDSITRRPARTTRSPRTREEFSPAASTRRRFTNRSVSSAPRATSTTAESLTIIATALIETGSRMDEVIFEEFKGTGNMELVLDSKISDRRIYPAIDLMRSGTRKEELLLTQEELNRMWVLRKFLATMTPIEMMEFLNEKICSTKTNKEFLEAMKS